MDRHTYVCSVAHVTELAIKVKLQYKQSEVVRYVCVCGGGGGRGLTEMMEMNIMAAHTVPGAR